MPLTVQFRAHSHPEPATFKIDDQDRLAVIFPKTTAIRGVAPGQPLVIYHGNWTTAQAGITGTQSANPRQDIIESQLSKSRLTQIPSTGMTPCHQASATAGHEPGFVLDLVNTTVKSLIPYIRDLNAPRGSDYRVLHADERNRARA